jgi:copper chaperone CopZ
MKYHFKAENIHCQNCANTIKVSLEDDFGKIEIDLENEPKVVTVSLENDEQVAAFKSEMAELGFDILGQV